MVTASLLLTQPQSEEKQFIASTGSGRHLIIDDKDGGTGPTPMELVAVAVGGCTAFDVISILRKKRQSVTGYEVKVEAEQVENPPRVFHTVRIHHIVRGEVEEKALQDAIHLSETKYCSVGAMIQWGAKLETTYEIVPAADAVSGGRNGG